MIWLCIVPTKLCQSDGRLELVCDTSPTVFFFFLNFFLECFGIAFRTILIVVGVWLVTTYNQGNITAKTCDDKFVISEDLVVPDVRKSLDT